MIDTIPKKIFIAVVIILLVKAGFIMWNNYQPQTYSRVSFDASHVGIAADVVFDVSNERSYIIGYDVAFNPQDKEGMELAKHLAGDAYLPNAFSLNNKGAYLPVNIKLVKINGVNRDVIIDKVSDKQIAWASGNDYFEKMLDIIHLTRGKYELTITLTNKPENQITLTSYIVIKSMQPSGIEW